MEKINYTHSTSVNADIRNDCLQEILQSFYRVKDTYFKSGFFEVFLVSHHSSIHSFLESIIRKMFVSLNELY